MLTLRVVSLIGGDFRSELVVSKKGFGGVLRDFNVVCNVRERRGVGELDGSSGEVEWREFQTFLYDMHLIYAFVGEEVVGEGEHELTISVSNNTSTTDRV